MAGLKDQALYSSKDEEAEGDDYYSEEEEAEEEDSDDEEEEEEDTLLKEPRKDAVYNTVRLHEKLEEIGWPDNIDWIEKLCIDYKKEGEIDVNDDLAREMAFYTQALEGTREAYNKLQATELPFLRPEDYYAEMVKTDQHMMKVKDKLLFQKQKIEEAEERRKSREAKKMSKAIQVAKLKERTKQKKNDIESVKKWRKMRQNSGFKEGDDEMPLDFTEGQTPFQRGKKMRPGVSPGDRSGGKGRNMAAFSGGKERSKAFSGEKARNKAFSGEKGRNKAFSRGEKGRNKAFSGGEKRGKGRDYKDTKFGHGGRKRMGKQNTADSAADVSGFKSDRKNNKRKRRPN